MLFGLGEIGQPGGGGLAKPANALSLTAYKAYRSPTESYNNQDIFGVKRGHHPLPLPQLRSPCSQRLFII